MNIIPELRFSEFEKDGEWRTKTLGDIVDSESSSLALNKIELRVKGYSVYGADSVVGYIDDYHQEDKYISIVKDGSGVGRLKLCEPKSSILGTLAYIKSKDKKEYILDWIYYLMNTINFNSYKKGSGIPHIYFSDFKIESVGVPKPTEQRKIASCLTSLDELIAAQNDKLEAFKDHKKGLLQSLFPQEGETVPEVRFPEFEGKGEWKPSTVEDTCLVKGRIGYRGYTKQDLVKDGEGVLVLGGKNIQNQLLDLSDRTFLSWDKYYESPEIMVKMNHIIFSQRGTLGDCAIIDKEIGKATINPSMVLLRDITCNPKFLYYILIGNTVQEEVTRNSTSSAVPMLSQKQIREFSFLIPHPSEQDKIASALSALDELLIAQQKKIDELQEHKKGLMQGLFPTIER